MIRMMAMDANADFSIFYNYNLHNEILNLLLLVDWSLTKAVLVRSRRGSRVRCVDV
jgi:hypothetical protein